MGQISFLDVGCVNPDCGRYGVKGLGNIVIRRRYGTGRIRFLHCRHCQHEFSERNGTPLFDLRISQEKIVAVVRHLAEGTGVRKTARLTGVSRDTVGRILRRVGSHARGIHDRLVRGLDVPEVQMNEMWSFVKKKDKNCTEKERFEGEAGSVWDHIAIDPVSKLVVSMVQGSRRDQESSDRLVKDFADRTNNKPLKLVTTDEHAAYEASLLVTIQHPFKKSLDMKAFVRASPRTPPGLCPGPAREPAPWTPIRGRVLNSYPC
ncbi:MAG: IS1 family transposase [Magnetococcales bacterium]|nr:IS1 family transposase [Magnetococcales bacterium]MBF0322161.1 IS1 family transposase [Magnetococcales bacterium]